MRGFIERLSRQVVLKRKLPKRFHSLPLYVSPGSALCYWKSLGRADPFLLEMCATLIKRGDIVWDIGANVGLFSFSAAALSGPEGKVIAIEPDLFLSHLLQKSAKLIKDDYSALAAKVDILPVAIADKVSLMEFNIAERGRATNFLVKATFASAREVRNTQSVVAVTLDWLLDFSPAPTIVKIDVECAEDMVLQGASKLLREIRPRILCEVTGGLRDVVGEIFLRNNYALYDAETDPGATKKLLCAAFNTLAIPE